MLCLSGFELYSRWVPLRKEMVFRQKPLEKADFILKMTGPAGQF